jgi:hypothetical protein
MRAAHSDTVDVPGIARYHADLYGQSLDRLVELTDAGTLVPERVTHTTFADFVADPLEVVDGCYEHLGWLRSPEARDAMVAYLGAHPPGRLGRHDYSFAGLGLDADRERARFARYVEQFAVPTGPVA